MWVNVHGNVCTLTFFVEDVDAGVVKQEVLEAIAVRIDMRLPAEARRSEKSESLQRSQGCLTLSHRHRRASHCNRKIIIRVTQQRGPGSDDKSRSQILTYDSFAAVARKTAYKGVTRTVHTRIDQWHAEHKLPFSGIAKVFYSSG